MKTLLAVVATVLLAVLVQHALSAESSSSMPPGVAADQWIVISDNTGFLIAPQKPAIYQSTGTSVLTGHFFAKRNGEWYRLNVGQIGALVETR